MSGTAAGGRAAVETIKAREGEDAMRIRGGKGGAARKAQGVDYRALGKKGGEARKAQGVDYSELGRKGGESAHGSKHKQEEGIHG